MSTTSEINDITFEAFASKSDPTSGRIVSNVNGVKQTIQAVVFSRSEIDRMFEGVDDLIPRMSQSEPVRHSSFLSIIRTITGFFRLISPF